METIYINTIIPELENSGIDEVDDEGELGLFTILIISSSVIEKSDLYLATSANFLASSRVAIFKLNNYLKTILVQILTKLGKFFNNNKSHFILYLIL